ncbi:MAG: hypothetical protein ACP59X_19845 [Solidesulfovibrio sp. DCME]|uniref:hypothetical protein n=1 Tax=Solidesulfovibrio sp. DCME TaxID=3447380 RepID=UPI003D140757
MRHRFPVRAVPMPLEDFSALVRETAVLRRQAAGAILAGRPVPPGLAADLGRVRDALDAAIERDERLVLELGDEQLLHLEMDEERAQLENDIVYLEEGREALLKHLAKRHHGFRDAVRRALRELAPPSVNLLVCQAGALFRAPGQRRLTAVQPAWNAVALGRFAAARAKRPVLWSAGPLSGPGLADLCAVPPQEFTLAASMGRQIVDTTGRESAWPLPLAQASLLESINARLAMLLAEPDWRGFAYVGSGLQFRRGETVIARQDGRDSLDEDASLALLEHVHDIVDAVDPERDHFRVEDDGRDVTVSPTAPGGETSWAFSPDEGLRALADSLACDLGQGPHLACCGGPAGLELLEALVAHTRDVRCLFVTDREELGRKARELCPTTTVVAHPDIAAAIFSAAAP